jgi:hypothetical protein
MNSPSLRQELVQALGVISHARAHGLTQERLEAAATDFCAQCPDPVQAYWLFSECPDRMSDEALVDRALGAPARSMSGVPTAIVPADHPARRAVRGA